MVHKARVFGDRLCPLNTAGKDVWRTVCFDLPRHYRVMGLLALLNLQQKACPFQLLPSGHCEILISRCFLFYAQGSSLNVIMVRRRKFSFHI